MRYDGLYVDVKRMGLALDGLIRREYPGDFLQFVEMSTFAKPRQPRRDRRPDAQAGDGLRARWCGSTCDMSDPRRSARCDVPPHFTNIQHGLQLARQFLAAQDTPNRQIILITDGLPTAHFEDQHLYLLYPPHRRTEEATMREGPALPARGDHDQHLPAAQLVAVERGRAVRLPAGRIDRRQGLLHRRQGPRPLRGLGLPQPAAGNRIVIVAQSSRSTGILPVLRGLCHFDAESVAYDSPGKAPAAQPRSAALGLGRRNAVSTLKGSDGCIPGPKLPSDHQFCIRVDRGPGPHTAYPGLAPHFVGQVLVLGVAEAPHLIALHPLGLHLADHVIVVGKDGFPEFPGQPLDGVLSDPRNSGGSSD